MFKKENVWRTEVDSSDLLIEERSKYRKEIEYE